MKLIDRFGQFEIYLTSIFILTPLLFLYLSGLCHNPCLPCLDSKVVPEEDDRISFSDLQCISNLWFSSINIVQNREEAVTLYHICTDISKKFLTLQQTFYKVYKKCLKKFMIRNFVLIVKMSLLTKKMH